MSLETDRIEAELNQSRNKLSDTLDALGNKLSPDQIANEVAGMAKEQARKVANGVTRQVRENPVPLLLIGAGVALLVYNNRKSIASTIHADDWSSDRRYRTLEEARWATPRQPNETDDAYNDRVHDVYAGALGLKQKAGEALHDFKARVLSAVESTKIAAADARDRISHAISGGAHYVSDKASDSARYISHKANDGAHYVGRKASQARHATEDVYQENPLAIGGMLLGIGALIGFLAPLSQPEREGLRGIADKAARTGADLADRGVRMVEDRVEGAVH